VNTDIQIEYPNFRKITPCSCNVCPRNLAGCHCSEVGKCSIEEDSINFALLQKENGIDYIVLLLCMDENTKNIKSAESADKAEKIETCSLLKEYNKESRFFNFFIPLPELPKASSEMLSKKRPSQDGKWETIRQFINNINSGKFFHNEIKECKVSNFPELENFFVKKTLEVRLHKDEGVELIRDKHMFTPDLV
jgi:hypothetical protein